MEISIRSASPVISKALISQCKDQVKTTGACGLIPKAEKTNAIGNRLYPAAGFNLVEHNLYFWSQTD